MKNVQTFAMPALFAISVFAADNATAIDGIQRFVPKARLASEHLPAALLAGHYVHSGPEVQRRAGPALTGADLYLFSDGSYLWAWIR